MPLVARLESGTRGEQYYRDHNPPHFPGPDHRLKVTWADGTNSIVDMSGGVIGSGIFAPLMDPALFSSARVGDRSRTVEWRIPSGTTEEALVDIDADALFEMSEPIASCEDQDVAVHG